MGFGSRHLDRTIERLEARSMNRIRLTPAQQSALECRGLEDPVGEQEKLVARAWDGAMLRFADADREAVFDAINEMSNAEDAAHQETGDVFAGRAARSLGALASRVLRTGR